MRGRLALVERQQVDLEDRPDLACEAAHREQVGAVRGDLDLEHRVAQRQPRDERLAWREARPQNEDAVVLVREIELLLAQDHAAGELTAQGAVDDLATIAQHRAGQRHGDGVSGAEVPCAADDLAGCALACVELAELQAVGVRVLSRLEHEARDHGGVVLRRCREAAFVDRLELGGADRQAGAQRVERWQLGEVIGEPRERRFHRPAPANWRKKRRSSS